MSAFRRTREPRHAVVEDDVVDVRQDRFTETERRWAFDGSDVVALLVGLFYVVIGILALIELGFDGYPSEVTTEVMGLAHTQLWATISIVLGLLLLGGVGGVGRGLTTFSAALLMVIGIVVVAATNDLDSTLATNSAYGWTAIVLGAVVLLAAIAVPTVAARSHRVIDSAA